MTEFTDVIKLRLNDLLKNSLTTIFIIKVKLKINLNFILGGFKQIFHDEVTSAAKNVHFIDVCGSEH